MKYRAAGIFLKNNHSVLLLRRADNGLWSTPGGLAEAGERPLDTATREFEEECGVRLALVAERSPFLMMEHSGYAMFFVRSRRFRPRLCEENDRSQWVPLFPLLVGGLHTGFPLHAPLEQMLARMSFRQKKLMLEQ